MLKELLKIYYKPKRAFWLELIIYFIVGFIFAPISRGFFILLLFIVLEEILVYYSYYNTPSWHIEIRGALISAYILGFLIGRSFFNLDPYHVGSLPFTDWPQCNHDKMKSLKKEINLKMRVLKFGADFCKKCKDCQPAFESLISEKKIDAEYINAEKEEEMVLLYEVKKLPAFIVLKDDKEIGRCQTVEELAKILN